MNYPFILNSYQVSEQTQMKLQQKDQMWTGRILLSNKVFVLFLRKLKENFICFFFKLQSRPETLELEHERALWCVYGYIKKCMPSHPSHLSQQSHPSHPSIPARTRCRINFYVFQFHTHSIHSIQDQMQDNLLCIPYPFHPFHSGLDAG